MPPKNSTSALPIAIIGGGPIGLAAAAHLITKQQTPFVVLEAGEQAGDSIRKWAHVRLFTPWRHLVDSAAALLLTESGWTAPRADDYPTGREFVERYLRPLSRLPALRPHIRFGAPVSAISRQGFDKMKSAGREQAPFVLQFGFRADEEETLFARAVIDASGTYRTPNPLGANGLFASGEKAFASRIFYGIPDVLGSELTRYAGRRALVVGSGHSAFNALLDLARLRRRDPTTQIFWAVRKESEHHLYGGGDDDALPERGALGSRLRELVESGAITLLLDFRVERLLLPASKAGVIVESDTGKALQVDEIIAATGYRPDLAFLSELRIALEATVESPPALAPLIDPNVHSCGSVPPHGAIELAHPERDFYIVGMKSYGRAPTFLMLTGYEQVRSVVAALAGDWQSARKVELVLPETGVCNSDIVCEAALVEISR